MKSPINAAVAIAILVAVAAGWWVLRAPAVERRVVATPPEPDIDPPGLRARREAAVGLASAPDDPWTFAEGVAASASPASAPREECGIADRPAVDLPPGADRAPVQVGGASPRYVGAQARVDAALRASADPLDRAVADLANAGDMRSEAGRVEAVVQQAAATADPRLYALGYRLCESTPAAAPSCRLVSADRWIQLDPGNGVPWLTVLRDAQARGDAAGERTAMDHLAASTRFDVYPLAATGVVARRATSDDADLAAINDLSFKVTTTEATLAWPPFQALIPACRREAGGDAQLAQSCRTISDTLFAQSDTEIGLSMSGAVLLQMNGDASRRDFVHAERAIAAARWSPATGFSPCQDMRDSLKAQRRVAEIGEVAAMRERAHQFVAP